MLEGRPVQAQARAQVEAARPRLWPDMRCNIPSQGATVRIAYLPYFRRRVALPPADRATFPELPLPTFRSDCLFAALSCYVASPLQSRRIVAAYRCK